MKTRHYLVNGILLLLVALGITSCVMTCDRPISGDQIVESRHHRGFERIEISGSPTVVYTQADTIGVRLEGPEKMVENIVTEVEDHILYIHNKGRVNLKVGFINLNWGDKDDVTVYVSSPDLVGVRLNGSGDFISRKQVDTDVMDIVLRGSGDIDFEDIICDACTTELVGSGDININRLDTRKSTAVLVGSGDINIIQTNVVETDISLKGSGDITLKGTLNHYDGHKNGSGDIDTNQLKVR